MVKLETMIVIYNFEITADNSQKMFFVGHIIDQEEVYAVFLIFVGCIVKLLTVRSVFKVL